MKMNVQEKQGFVGNLNDKSDEQLVEMLQRQEKLLKNKKFVSSLPDGGRKVSLMAHHLATLLSDRQKLNQTAHLLAGLTIDSHDCEMKVEEEETDGLKLQIKDVNVITRMNSRQACKDRVVFQPNRTLRSDLSDLPEESYAETPGSLSSYSEVPSSRSKRIPKEDTPMKNDDGELKTVITMAKSATEDEITQYELLCPNLNQVSVPTYLELDLSPEKYSIIIFHTLTNRPGEHADICQLVANNESETLVEYCLPPYIASNTSKLHGVKIEYRKGVRILTQNGDDTHAQSTELVLKKFLGYIDDVRNNKEIILLSIGQTNTLLHNLKLHQVHAPDVIFAECSKSVLKSTVNIGPVVSSRRVVDILSRVVSEQDFSKSCQFYDLSNAKLRMEESMARVRRLNSMRGKLFDFSMKERDVISGRTARRLTEEGLSYTDLDALYRVSEKAMVTILVNRGIDENDLVKLVHHYRYKQGSHSFDAALVEGGQATDKGAVLVPLEESLQLMHLQKIRMKQYQTEQAKMKLKRAIESQMTPFDPEATQASLNYREPVRDDSDNDDEDSSDSEVEQDYPE